MARFGWVFSAEGTRLGLEFGANIISVMTPSGLKYQLTDFRISTAFKSDGIGWNAPVPGRLNEDNYVALVHTHPDNGNFSPTDFDVAITREIDAYIIRADGVTRYFSYSNYVKMGAPSSRNVYYNQDLYVK